VRPRVQKPLPLVLPVDLHKEAPDLPQGSYGDRGSVRVRPAPASDLPDQDEELVFHGDAGCVQGRPDLRGPGEFEDRLHPGLRRPGAYHIRTHPVPKTGPQGVQEDGFARARLAREDVEAGPELHPHVLQKGEVARVELPEHYRPPQPNFLLRRS
jgi:hypothetical protein